MRLPKIVYENMPYLYFVASALCFVYAENIYLFFSAAILYFAGTFVWCMRSSYRRKDTPSRFAKSIFNFRLGDSLYELMPFLEFALGICIIHFFTIDIVIACGFIFCFIGVKNLIMRIINRRKYTAELAFGKRMAGKKAE
ncbi:hypothetical protein A9Q98_08620 [Thalassotalea sp. 42_200_T64]|nr:hypothetical protein A9Q98_08620 [Thalassotalea sp. 42_200_T64]